jgi:hypothetical protein
MAAAAKARDFINASTERGDCSKNEPHTTRRGFLCRKRSRIMMHNRAVEVCDVFVTKTMHSGRSGWIIRGGSLHSAPPSRGIQGMDVADEQSQGEQPMGDETMDKVDEIAALLGEAAEAHAQVYRISEGEDPDWASWYAKWLIDLSEFSELLDADVVPSHLIYELVRLEREYNETQPDEAWEMYYATQLLEEFGSADDETDDEDEDDEDDDFEDEDEESEDEELVH